MGFGQRVPRTHLQNFRWPVRASRMPDQVAEGQIRWPRAMLTTCLSLCVFAIRSHLPTMCDEMRPETGSFFRSQEFKCPDCGIIKDKLKDVTEASKAETQEAKELASQINFQVHFQKFFS